MIIFGTGRKRISGSEHRLPNPCPSCGQPAMMQVVFQQYFHLFWIPTLPTGKTAVAACGHCQRSMQIPVPPTGTPFWSFAGAFVFGGIMALSIASSAVKGAVRNTATADAAQANPASLTTTTPPTTAAAPATPPPAAHPPAHAAPKHH